jgi:hypothetical protein
VIRARLLTVATCNSPTTSITKVNLGRNRTGSLAGSEIRLVGSSVPYAATAAGAKRFRTPAQPAVIKTDYTKWMMDIGAVTGDCPPQALPTELLTECLRVFLQTQDKRLRGGQAAKIGVNLPPPTCKACRNGRIVAWRSNIASA